MVLPLWEKAWHFFRKSDLEFPCVHAKLLQLYLTLCKSMDHSLPASLSMGFSRQEYWSELPGPYRGDLASFMSPAWAGGFFTTSTTWEAQVAYKQ